jgi:hypothetical protein
VSGKFQNMTNNTVLSDRSTVLVSTSSAMSSALAALAWLLPSDMYG